MAPQLRGAAVLLALLASVACSAQRSQRVADPTPTARKARATPAERPPIKPPDEVRVQNAALGGSRARVRQAISDLKAVGLWDRLTGHLYVAKFASRLGTENVPSDGHLADAFLSALVEDGVGGPLCDVMFFPTAIDQDLRRWQSYYDRGLLDRVPPQSLRQFWGAVMAHELAHCLSHGRGEPAAERFEERALAALREAGIGAGG